MNTESPQSVRDVCNSGVLAGKESDPRAAPNLLIEIPHGATRSLHYESLRGLLRGHYPDDLIDFFHVNTDVGAPEVAVAVARGVLERCPAVRIRVLRGLVPRTFVDCNRLPGAQGEPGASVSPQVPSYVTDPVDSQTVAAYHQSYLTQATAAYSEVCGHGGKALIVHTYAPRSVDIGSVDDSIVARLREAWAPQNVERWPRRPDVDLITATPDGVSLAPPALVRDLRQRYEAAQCVVAENGTYYLHAETLGFHWSESYVQQVLCVELNRESLVTEWIPLSALAVDATRVQRMAAPLIDALVASLDAN